MCEDSTVYLGTTTEKTEDNVSALNHPLIHWSIFSSEAIISFVSFLNVSRRIEEVKSCGLLVKEKKIIVSLCFHKSEKDGENLPMSKEYEAVLFLAVCN